MNEQVKAICAEIERHFLRAGRRTDKEHASHNAEMEKFGEDYWNGYRDLAYALLAFIDSLQAEQLIDGNKMIEPSKDLEKEIDNYISDNFFGSETFGFFANRTKEEPNYVDIANAARHFYELGLKNAK